MKTWKGLITSIAIAAVTLISYPRASFAIDCSYGGVFKPPLPLVNGVCIASGSLKSQGSLILDSSSWMFIENGLKLSVTEEPGQLFPFVQLPGTLFVAPGGVLGTHPPTTLNPIAISAAGAIINNGFALNLWAPTDPILLRAAKGITLQGDKQHSPFLPTTFMLGDTVKVETIGGNITANNASFVSVGDQANVSFVAPHGNITLTDTQIFVLKNGTEVGECTFQPRKGTTVTFSADDVIVCIPRIKR